MPERCWWAGNDPDYIAYHDDEWGVPIRDDQLLFEFLCLEGQQAGLSWITVLKKRNHYRKCFNTLDRPPRAPLTQRTSQNLFQEPGLIRNR